MGAIDVALWENRAKDPAVIEMEFRGPKGREWLLKRLPARAHDNGIGLIFSNGVGRDDNEVRTGNAMILDPYGDVLAETWKAGDDMVLVDLKAETRAMCTGVRWIRSRRPKSCTRPCPRQPGANRISGPYVFPPPTPRQATEIRI